MNHECMVDCVLVISKQIDNIYWTQDGQDKCIVWQEKKKQNKHELFKMLRVSERATFIV